MEKVSNDFHFGKIIKRPDICASELPSAYDLKSDLPCFAFYTRINRAVLRVHSLNLKSGLIEFNVMSSNDKFSEKDIVNTFHNLVTEIIQKDKKWKLEFKQ